jgi:small nuclear ribonucleoprotein (snRNP)-like protein
MTKKPEEFLKKIIGKPVIVKLNSGLEYRGVMASLDGYLNVAMEQSEEWQNGKKSKEIIFSHFKSSFLWRCLHQRKQW